MWSATLVRVADYTIRVLLRIVTIVLSYTAIILPIIDYIQSIGSGIEIFSGLLGTIAPASREICLFPEAGYIIISYRKIILLNAEGNKLII